MALSVSRGQAFIVLFIAIVFHRRYPLLSPTSISLRRLSFFFLPTPWPTADTLSFLVSGHFGDLGVELRYYLILFVPDLVTQKPDQVRT